MPEDARGEGRAHCHDARPAVARRHKASRNLPRKRPETPTRQPRPSCGTSPTSTHRRRCRRSAGRSPSSPSTWRPASRAPSSQPDSASCSRRRTAWCEPRCREAALARLPADDPLHGAHDRRHGRRAAPRAVIPLSIGENRRAAAPPARASTKAKGTGRESVPATATSQPHRTPPGPCGHSHAGKLFSPARRREQWGMQVGEAVQDVIPDSDSS